VEHFDQLMPKSPGTSANAHDRATAYIARGVQLRGMKRLSQARAALETALVLEEGAIGNADRTAHSNQIAVILDSMGLVESDMKYPGRAEGHYKEALAIWDKLASDLGSGSEYAASRAMVHEHLGQAYRSLGRIGPQRTALTEALSLRIKLRERHPDN